MKAATTKHVDYILVGQGLAGTLLAHQLESRGYSFVIFDEERRDSSSRLAAGVMNPITGRRFVKSWMYDTLLPKAIATYSHLEERLSCDLIKAVNILRVFPDHRMENDWIARSGFAEYEMYMVDQPDLDTFKQFDKNWKFGEVRGSYQVNVPKLLTASRTHWLELGILHECAFDHQKLGVAGAISYKDINASHIVFCEGERLRLNPLFKHRLLDVSRGDVLIVRIPNFTATKMIKKKYFLIHQDTDRFWFGAKNSWDVHDTLPKIAFREDLIKALENLIDVPYRIEDYRAAVRPTVQDRRPILGRHPEHSDVYLLNGLGTKGASLGPYWVDQLLAFISSGHSLPPEVDVSRFYG